MGFTPLRTYSNIMTGGWVDTNFGYLRSDILVSPLLLFLGEPTGAFH